MTAHSVPTSGLDGVVAAATALSHVDGARGRLVIAGLPVERLAAETGYESLAARLWSTAHDRPIADVDASLGKARQAAWQKLDRILPAAETLGAIGGLRAALAAIGEDEDLAPEAVLAGAGAVLAGALARRVGGKAPVAPDPSLGQAQDLLRMLRGEDVSRQEARAMETYLVTVSDHGMNASTFTARVVASTGADLFMSATAAYCALTGPLHGGAPEPVLEMLDAIAGRERIAPWIDDALARGQRLMGFGHRIYKVRDPRADVLRGAVEALGQGADLGFAAEVEAYARNALALSKPGRRLDTNVEFYTAILLDALGVPRQAFTPVFAVGRMLGWTAHAIEQQRTGRLLRPSSTYVGTLPQEEQAG